MVWPGGGGRRAGAGSSRCNRTWTAEHMEPGEPGQKVGQPFRKVDRPTKQGANHFAQVALKQAGGATVASREPPEWMRLGGPPPCRALSKRCNSPEVGSVNAGSHWGTSRPPGAGLSTQQDRGGQPRVQPGCEEWGWRAGQELQEGAKWEGHCLFLAGPRRPAAPPGFGPPTMAGLVQGSSAILSSLVEPGTAGESGDAFALSNLSWDTPQATTSKGIQSHLPVFLRLSSQV